jgi:hypothetical protein
MGKTIPEDFMAEDEGEMPWETHARKAIERAGASIEKDELRGVLYMNDGEDHRFNPVRGEFTSWEDVMHALTRIGENQWVAYAPFDGGEPVFGPNVDGYVEDVMVENEVEDFFEIVAPPNDGEQLADAHDLLDYRAGLVAKVDLTEINEELVKYLALHPEKMHDLSPRKFEELVAELFRSKGYDVEIGRGTKDQGIDIRAFQRSDIGCLLTLVQCKRYARNHKVAVDAVRQLYGVVGRDDATTGIIVTTSTFTRDAQSEQRQLKYRIQLAEYSNVASWLKEYPRAQ